MLHRYLDDVELSRKRALFAAIVAVVVLAVLGLGVAESALTHQKSEFRATVNASNPDVGENVTVAVNTDSTLIFGSVPAGATVDKELEISSTYPARATVAVSGNISDTIEQTPVKFFEGETRIEISTTPPEPGFYSGEVKIRTAGGTGIIANRWIETQRSLHSVYY